MSKHCYILKSFNPEHLDLIHAANQILTDYIRRGFDLTLRQLYYQFVSRNLFPASWADAVTGSTNNERSYKKLGSIINDARLAGLVDWDHIQDRTRNLQQLTHWDGPQDIIAACAGQYREDLWSSQLNYVEVWVEKDALVGVLEAACNPLRVPYFSCRGYTSQSEMWAAAMRLAKRADQHEGLHIIHLGDHDPSGVDMSRDIEDRLHMFLEHHSDRENFHFSRIALNMDQVRQYKPPPNPAKVTDSRARSYISTYGDESWELDALSPETLVELIQGKVHTLIQPAVWARCVGAESKSRDLLTAVSTRWDEVAQYVSRKKKAK